MSEILDKLALPFPKARSRKEFIFLTNKYNNSKTIQEKKIVLQDLLDIYIGYFDLYFNIKLRYDDKDSDDGNLHLNNLYKNTFEDAAYKLFAGCFYHYLSHMHLLKNNCVDPELFTVARLTCITKDQQSFEYLTKETFKGFCGVESEFAIDRVKTWNMLHEYELRNEELKSKINNYTTEEISPEEIKNVYRGLSSGVFNIMNKKEKIHLMRLLDMYFQYEEGDSKKYYGNNITGKTTNIEALQLLYEHISCKGNTIIDKKQNIDIMDNILSGVKYVYANEIYKDKIGKITADQLLKNKKR